jgi:LacI family transcriptional regulator
MRSAKDMGYKINHDIYFASYANLPMTSYLDNPPIASVEQYPRQQAEKATDILLELIETKGLLQLKNNIVLEGRLIINKKE